MTHRKEEPNQSPEPTSGLIYHVRQKKMSIPNVSSAEVVEYAKQLFPEEKIAQSLLNPDYGSWQVQIGGRDEKLWLEITWGPLSGFGGTDVKNLPADDPDIFAPYEVGFSSLEEAKQWLESAAKKEPNQPLQRNASTGPVLNFESPARRADQRTFGK